MSDMKPMSFFQAANDFDEARRKAALEEIAGFLTGHATHLVPYDEIRKRLWRTRSSPPRIEEVPLDAIVGSVSRITDFTRSFMPRKDSDKSRWTNVKIAQEQHSGLPPVDLYQVGNVYFVLDGHHRISVARSLGADSIQALVSVVDSDTPLEPGDSPDALILKTERASFYDQTHLQDVLPGVDLEISAAGDYPRLLEHISVHQYYMGIEQNRSISDREALLDWYEKIYQPIVQVIRRRNLLRDFPHRTETDLYLWLSEHRFQVSENLGWQVPTALAARDLTTRFSLRPAVAWPVIREKIYRALVPDPLEIGPEPGEWRRERESAPGQQVFRHVLIALSANSNGWDAFQVGMKIAAMEGAFIGGLHVVKNKQQANSAVVEELRGEFARRCDENRVQGNLAVAVGPVARTICERSYWTDLTVIRLAYPPPLRFLQRFRSGMRMLIRLCPAPLLVVPGPEVNFRKVLVAFDDSPKSREALFVATYMAERFQTELVVLTVHPDEATAQAAGQAAREYLESRSVQAAVIVESGQPGERILRNARKTQSDMILMGGYSKGPMRELIYGSTVDRVLHGTQVPVLICR